MKNIEALLERLEQEEGEPTGDQVVLDWDSVEDNWTAQLVDKKGHVLYHSVDGNTALSAKHRSSVQALVDLDRLVGRKDL